MNMRWVRRMPGAACLAATLAVGLAGKPVSAQSTETAPPPRLDSAAAANAARSDTARRDTIRRDTTRRDTTRGTSGDSLPGGDSLAVGDSLPVGDSLAARADSATPAPAAQPPAPVDSLLRGACDGSAADAPDLLIVKFRPATTAAEREAVAREVEGTLVGPSESMEPGSWYLRVPGAAADPSVADRLIVLSPVLEVGSTRCPSGASVRP